MRQEQWASQSHTEIASICWLARVSFVGAIQGTDHNYVPNNALCYVRTTERTVHMHVTTAVALILDLVYVCIYMCTYVFVYVNAVLRSCCSCVCHCVPE